MLVQGRFSNPWIQNKTFFQVHLVSSFKKHLNVESEVTNYCCGAVSTDFISLMRLTLVSTLKLSIITGLAEYHARIQIIIHAVGEKFTSGFMVCPCRALLSGDVQNLT